MNYAVEIKEHHLDTFGHVNNAVYLQLFEEARWEFITQRGFGLKEVMERQQGPVILEAHVKFLKELKLREKIEITFEPENMTASVGKCRQKMLNARGEVLCEAEFVVGFFDMRSRRLARPPVEWVRVVSGNGL
jgi:YbgC/YbaW family acyl-CoA thioester hydrolase